MALFQVLIPRTALARFAGRQSGTLISLAARLARTLMVLAWLVCALQSFRVYRPLSALLVTVLTHRFQLGPDIDQPRQHRGVCGGGLGCLLAGQNHPAAARRRLLPALALPRGVGDRISTLTYYSIGSQPSLGARVPITLTSWADLVQSRLASCAVAALVAYRHRELAVKGALA